jgi:hypothetical protein
MKHLLMLVLLVIAGQLSAKKPAFDSIKPYESATIQYQKKMQGLYDEVNKKYIVPLSNVEIYELANGFYGIADPKTRLVQIIFHNEFYTFKTSWQTKQMVLDKSDYFEYAGIFSLTNQPTFQMENYLVVEGGKGYINSKYNAENSNQIYAYLGYFENNFFVYQQENLENKKPNSNKKQLATLISIH